jgi:ubiquinol-cytochrome c reductase cytochrome b subunit
VVFLMPLIGKWRLGHGFNLGLLAALLAGATVLTYLAKQKDRHNPKYLAAAQEAERNAERVKVLARSSTGIPVTGAVTLLRTDPLTQGPKLFARNCASCHRYGGTDATGLVPGDPPAASDLKGFASREWLAGLLDPDRISSPQYFGATKFKDGKMARFVHKTLASPSPEEKENVRKAALAVSAAAKLKSQAGLDKQDAALIEAGRSLLLNNQVRCTECHQFEKRDEEATAPDLTGYGSREWLLAFISDPGHERFYGNRNDHMPAFGKDQYLDEQSIGLIVDWLRGEWYEPPPQSAAVASSAEAPNALRLASAPSGGILRPENP